MLYNEVPLEDTNSSQAWEYELSWGMIMNSNGIMYSWHEDAHEH